jgi:hypothetical protein
MSINDSQIQRIKCEEQIKYLIDLRQRFRQVDKSISIKKKYIYSILVFKTKFKYNLVFRCPSEKKTRGKHGILESCGLLWNPVESYGIHRNPWNRTESTRILQNLAVLSLKALGCTLLQETLLKYINN